MGKILKGATCILLTVLLFIPCNISNGTIIEKNLFVCWNGRSNRISASMLQDNLVPNPSFEEGDEMPTGWNFDNEGDEEVVFNWDSNYAHSGDKSVGVTNIKKKTIWYRWYTVDFIPVDPLNYTYKESIYYNYIGTSADNQFGLLGLEFYNESRKRIFGYSILLLPSSSGWHQMEWYPLSYAYEYFPDIVNETKYVRPIIAHTYFREGMVNPEVEIRFDDIFFGIVENHPPTKPKITGPEKGKVGEEYEFEVVATDPDGDKIDYYVDWGDGTYEWYYYHDSGKKVKISHIWNKTGIYEIKVKARDIGMLESDWSDPIVISMPKDRRNLFSWFEKLLIKVLPGIFNGWKT